MIIDTQQKLESHLRIFKFKAKKAGAGEYQFYPMFILHYDRNRENYAMPKHIVLDTACEILIEED